MAIGDQLFQALSGIGQNYYNASMRNAEAQRLREAEARARGYQLEDETRRRGYQDEDYMKNLRRQAARMPGVETATEAEIQEWLIKQGRADKVDEATDLAEASAGVDLVKRAAALKAYLPEGVDPRTATEEDVLFAEQQKHIADNLPKAEQAYAIYQDALKREADAINQASQEGNAEPLVLPGDTRIKEERNAAVAAYKQVKSAGTPEEQLSRAREFLRNYGSLSGIDKLELDTLPAADAMKRADETVAQAVNNTEAWAQQKMGEKTYTALKNQDQRALLAYSRDPLSKKDKVELAQVQEAMAARAKAYQELISLRMPVDYSKGSTAEALDFAYKVSNGEFKDPKAFSAARKAASDAFTKVMDPKTGLGHGASSQVILDTGDISKKGERISYADFAKANPDSPAVTGSLSDVATTPPPRAPMLDEIPDPLSQISVGATPEQITAAREQSRALQLRKKLAQDTAALLAEEERYLARAFEDAKNPRKAQIRQSGAGIGGSPWNVSGGAIQSEEDITANYQQQLAKVEALRKKLAALRSGTAEQPPGPAYTPVDTDFSGMLSR